MIGVLVLIGAVVLLVLMLYLEIAALQARPINKTALRVTASANLTLIAYELVMILFIVGFRLLAEESQHPFLLETFSVTVTWLFGIFFTIWILVFNALRYTRVGFPKRNIGTASDAYFKSIKDGDPYEGIDYVISYIEDPRWGCPQTDIDKFLLYLAKRDDKFGQAAREKLNEMGD
jgi:hypothetical protein